MWAPTPTPRPKPWPWPGPAGRGALGPDAPAVWATAGLHPHEAALGAASVAPLIEAAVAEADGALVAVGECGLDYFYEHAPRHEQRRAFAAQIGLAQLWGLTLVIHARDAWDDLFAVLGSEGVPRRTVLHCFTGGPAELEPLPGGPHVRVLQRHRDLQERRAGPPGRRRCPSTACWSRRTVPFLAPVPHRGRPNEPAYVALVGAAVAEVKDLAPEVVAASSGAAARQAFSL